MIDPAPRPSRKSAWHLAAVRRTPLLIVAALLLLLAAAMLLWSRHLRHEQLQARLLRTSPYDIAQDRALAAAAVQMARPLFAAHCARCHGADLKGNQAIGAPDLTDRQWLYGAGSVFDIERTVLYGVRSGLSKSRNITDMPAFGLTGRLSEAEIDNLVQYLLQLRGQPHLSGAAAAGRAVYSSVAQANCGDCHGESAAGNSDYGAPDLTDAAGGDARALHDAIYFGQHRIMPGWINVLSLAEIRALAVFVYLAGQR